MLFKGVSIMEVLADQKRQLKKKIQELKPDYVLSVSEEDLVKSLTYEYTLVTPEINEEEIHIDFGEEQIDVSRDPMRTIYDRSRPFYVNGTRITFIIPFSGDAGLFNVQPQNFTFSSSGSKARIVGNEIHIAYVGTEIRPEIVKGRFDQELQLLKQNLANLRAGIDRHNGEIEGEIRNLIDSRKKKLLRDANLVESFGFPVKRRNGAPTTYAVPVQKRRPNIDRPPAPQGAFKPEPSLAMTDYEEILSIIQNMVRVMEQSPKAFENMGEEDLRTHFLVQLNGQYEGRATGETFNFQGKTDILIREEGQNVFVAECKFWAGEKRLMETIDQLLSYLSWRDTKAAVLIFSRNANFTEVLSKIEAAAPTHPNYKRTIGKLKESTFRYVFYQANDPNREVILTVEAFDVPRPAKGTV
jgi:hypothetical protein